MAVRIDPALGDALARGATLPFDWYTDPELLRLEQDRIFRRAWQYAGHTGRLAEPGSFFTAAAGLIPIVVTRTRDDDLKAFVNVCRHRGHQVAQGEGKRETLQCAYHAWTYGLDGKLRAAPRADREPDFDPGHLSLLPVQIDTWGPFVFVNPDAEAPPLQETLGRLPELLAEVVDVDALAFHHRATSDLETNWKVACENFLECYHCATAHPTFSAVVDVAPDSYRLEAEGLFSSQFGPVRAAAAPSFATGEVERSQFHFLWPNTGINVFPGRANLSIGPIVPTGTERTARFLDYFFGEDVDDAWIAELLELDAQVGREDTALVEGVQRGLRSGALDHGHLMVASEPLIQHFQRLTFEALSA
ncbi:MAG: aromatic ring-hydroxylating dioxygenase subunit alpha [Actinomycetota bacterium]|nr:aromatic ring-hydroxylating dioxygenase subunit alpha [Actinomycetota bacterium]